MQFDEAVIGQIGLEGFDEPIAVGARKDKGPFFAPVDVAFGIRVASDVHPEASPFFRVLGLAQKLVDISFPCVGSLVLFVILDLLPSGGQPGRDTVESSKLCASIGRCEGFEAQVDHRGTQVGIDPVLAFGYLYVYDFGWLLEHRMLKHRFPEGPMQLGVLFDRLMGIFRRISLFVLGWKVSALEDPSFESFFLGGAQGLLRIGGWHPKLGVLREDSIEQGARFELVGKDDGARVSSLCEG